MTWIGFAVDVIDRNVGRIVFSDSDEAVLLYGCGEDAVSLVIDELTDYVWLRRYSERSAGVGCSAGRWGWSRVWKID